MKKSRHARALTAVALAAAAVLSAAGPASADVRPTRHCAADEVMPRIGEGSSPRPGTTRLFTVGFRTVNGTSCLLSGALDFIRFYDTSGRPLDVRFSTKAAVAPFEDVWVDGFRWAAVYISSPAGDGGMPIGSMAFSAPTTPAAEFTAAWPGPVNGPLYISKITAPVS
ncbi:hypothetical protein [Lentzea sp. NPDC004782]|uniref:hypothetical protein n=1 Tax=Lentzea sp. NPDC004782 TaxID=3154458 RepID=UPI0033B479E9